MKHITFDRVVMVAMLIAIIVLGLKLGCSKPVVNRVDTYTHSDTTIHLKDSTIVYAPQKSQTYYTHKDSVVIREFHYADTALLKQVVADYFASHVYTDKKNIDTFGVVQITDTVSGNQIKGRGFTYNFKFPTVTNTVTNNIYPIKRHYYLGAGLGGNDNDFLNYGYLGAAYLDKKSNMFVFTYGKDRQYNNVFSLSYFKKLR